MRIRVGLPFVVAEMLVDACKAEALNVGKPMSISIVDAEGGLQLFTRMDGTLPVSTELSFSKAYTAATIRIPSHEVGKLAQPGAALYGIQNGHNGKIVTFGGGFPLCLNGVVAGAVGVSGGSVDEDMQVALPAVKLLKEMEIWSESIQGLVSATVAEPFTLGPVKAALRNAFLHAQPPLDAEVIPALVGGVILALT